MAFKHYCALLLLVLSFGVLGCQDEATHISADERGFAEKSTSLRTEKTQLFKLTPNYERDCMEVKELRTLDMKEAEAAGVQSPMALCEERLKPVKNSQSVVFDEETQKDNRDPSRFECYRVSKVKQAMDKFEICE